MKEYLMIMFGAVVFVALLTFLIWFMTNEKIRIYKEKAEICMEYADDCMLEMR